MSLIPSEAAPQTVATLAKSVGELSQLPRSGERGYYKQSKILAATLPAPAGLDFRRTSLVVLNLSDRRLAVAVVTVIRISEARQTDRIAAMILRVCGLLVTKTLPKMTTLPILIPFGACS